MSLLVVIALAGVLMQSPAPDSGAVSGQVIESDSGNPIAGAQVTLTRILTGPRVRPPFDRPPTATTDRDGRYRFQNVEPGEYQLGVRKPGFASDFAQFPRVTLVGGEQRAGVDMQLFRGAVIPGRVIDEHGEPVIQARVTALRKSPYPPGARVPPGPRRGSLIPAGAGVETNDLGEFRLFGLPPGEYYVQAAAGPDIGAPAAVNGATTLPTYFPNTPDASGALTVTVAAGETAGAIEIRVITAAAFDVSGVVVDEAGQPVANAMVSLDPDDTDTPRGPRMGGWRRVHSDDAGRFTLSAVTGGRYTLLATAPIVTAAAPGRGQAVPGSAGAGLSTWVGSSVSSSGGVTTMTSNGVTVEYRADMGTRVAITVNQEDVTGLQVVVKVR